MNLFGRISFAIVVALGLAHLAPASAAACSCAGRSLEDTVASMSVVFVGTVARVQPIAGGRMRTTFRVQRTLKGLAPRERTVSVDWTPPDGVSCFTVAPRRGRWIVFANGTARPLSIGRCDQFTRPLSPYSEPSADEVIANVEAAIAAAPSAP